MARLVTRCAMVSVSLLLTACGSSGGHHGEGHDDGHAGHGGPHAHHGGMPHRFEDAERWTKVFDDPERDAWQRPDLVVQRVVGGRDDLTLADIGAGTGYFALRFAKALPKGAVIASDLERTMLAKVLVRADEAGLKNVTVAQASTTDAGLQQAVDVLFMCNTYHHIGDRTAYFQRLRERLAPNGRLVIVDFKPEAERGPPPDHKVSAAQVDAELGAAGYDLAEGWDDLPDQYIRVYRARR